MDKFTAMTRFIAVAQSGSFTRAAEQLGLPKSSVSEAVQQLEKQLGIRLFHRSTRRISLTSDGEHYLRASRDILAEIDALESHYQHQQTKLAGELRLDMPSRFASTLVIPALADWFDRYPNIKLKISHADYRIDPVKEGVDAVVRVGQVQDSNLLMKPLTRYRIVNCVSQSYVDQYGLPDTLDSLSRHKLIDYLPNMQSQTAYFEYEEHGQEKRLAMNSDLTVSGTDNYLQACLHGLGIAQIPLIGIEPYLRSGELVSFLSEYEAAPMAVSLLYPSRKQTNQRLSVFIDWLETLLQQRNRMLSDREKHI